jgi:hypothetical protein
MERPNRAITVPVDDAMAQKGLPLPLRPRAATDMMLDPGDQRLASMSTPYHEILLYSSYPPTLEDENSPFQRDTQAETVANENENEAEDQDDLSATEIHISSDSITSYNHKQVAKRSKFRIAMGAFLVLLIGSLSLVVSLYALGKLDLLRQLVAMVIQ